MCIVIYKPKNKIIPKHYLENAFRYNSDGAGFLVHDSSNNKLICKKGFFTFKLFWKEYLKYYNHQCIIHFRIKTSGERNEDNCHPFFINDGLGFAHNGIIIIDQKDSRYSDTWHFNKKILQHYHRNCPEAWFNNRFKNLFDRINNPQCKSINLLSSKFVFMDKFGNISIINESAGDWEDGVWYSNKSYKNTKNKSSFEFINDETKKHNDIMTDYYGNHHNKYYRNNRKNKRQKVVRCFRCNHYIHPCVSVKFKNKVLCNNCYLKHNFYD